MATGTSTIDTGGNDLTWDAPLSGPGGLATAGTLTLAPTTENTYTGPTIVQSGTLVIGGPDVLPCGTALTVDGTLELGNSLTVASLAGSGTVKSSQTGPVTLTVAGDASTTFSGTIEDGYGSGPLTLAATGSGDFDLERHRHI